MSLTSTNATILFSVDTLFPAPVPLAGFSAALSTYSATLNA